MDQDLETLIMSERRKDMYGRVLLEGMQMVHEGKKSSTGPSQMIIDMNNSESTNSSGGLSTMSKSTRSSRGNSVHWDQDVDKMVESQKGRRDKNDREKIDSYVINYNLEKTEIDQWIRNNTTEAEGFWNVDISKLKATLPQKRWKKMVKAIRQDRTDRANEKKYDDPTLEKAIQNMSSFKLLTPAKEETKLSQVQKENKPSESGAT